jgi:arylsulfatase A-like enzyme
MHQRLRLTVLIALLVLSASLFAAPTVALRPNIVLILSDDHGWADVGWHSPEIKTPNLDKLAYAGARLEQFYAQPACSPARAALMTGRYPMRHGLQMGVIRPWADYGLPLEERTIAQMLDAAGYTTAIVGKWHLGHFNRAYLPEHRGFEHQYGLYTGATDYFTHSRDGGFDWHRDGKVDREKGYTTFLIANEAVRLIREQPVDKPLFLYVPFNAVHVPLQVPEKYKEPYASMPPRRRTYAGMVAAEDEAVGQIIAAIDAKGIRGNTLIIWASDNGGPEPGVVTSNLPLRSGKGFLYEGGIRVCAFATWDGHIKPGTVVNAPIHMVDWYPTFGKLAGANLEQKLPLDGLDAWPTISEGKPSPHDAILLNASPTAGAILMGNWKLVLNGAAGDAYNEGASNAASSAGDKTELVAKTVELFDLSKDISEKTNLADKYPEKVQELRARYDRFAHEAVLPKNKPRPAGWVAPQIWGEPK